jgi:hypothetical protein
MNQIGIVLYYFITNILIKRQEKFGKEKIWNPFACLTGQSDFMALFISLDCKRAVCYSPSQHN